MSDVFISYAKADNEVTQEITAIERKLRQTPSYLNPEHNIDVWRDENNIRISEHWQKEIERGIENSNCIVVFISPNYFASEVCNEELALALTLGKKVIPVWFEAVDDLSIQKAIAQRNIQGKLGTATIEIINKNRQLIKDNQAIRYDVDNTPSKENSFNRLRAAIFENAKLDDLAREWLERLLAKDRGTGGWLTGADLKEALKWLNEARVKPNFRIHPETEKFVLDSRKNDKRRKVIMTAIGISAVLALIIIAIFAVQQQEGREKSDALAANKDAIALSQDVSTQALTLMGENPSLALLLAASSATVADTVQAQSNLIQMLQQLETTSGVINGPQHRVSALAFSPDNRYLVSGSWDGTLQVWDLETSAPIGERFGNVPPDDEMAIIPVTSISFHPDGKRMTSSGTYMLPEIPGAALWDMQNRTLIGYFEGSSVVNTFTSDGSRWLSTLDDNSIGIWDVASQKQLSSFSTPHQKFIEIIKLSPSDRLLATVSSQELFIWDVASGNQVAAVNVPQNENSFQAFQVTFSVDDKLLAAGKEDQVYIFNIENREIKQIPLPSGSILNLVFNNDHQILNVLSTTGYYQLAVESGAVVSSQDIYSTNEPELGLISDNGQYLVLAGGGGALQSTSPMIMVLNQINGGIPHFELPYANTADSILFTNNGNLLISSNDSLSLWGTDNTLSMTFSIGSKGALAVHPDGNLLVNRTENTIDFWDIGQGQLINTIADPPQSPPVFDVDPFDVSFSPNGQQLASLVGNCVTIWDKMASHVLSGPYCFYDEMPFLAYGLSWNPDGNFLFVSGRGSRFAVINLRDNSFSMHESGHNTGRALDFTDIKSSDFVVTLGADCKVRFWASDLLTESQPSIGNTEQCIEQVGLSLNRLVTRTTQGLIVWDNSQTLQLLGNIASSETNQYTQVEISTDGTKIAALDSFGRVNIWSLAIRDLQGRACQIAGRHLTREEWKLYFGDRPFVDVCE